MNLSRRQKIIIWTTVILIVLFLGLKTEYYTPLIPRSLNLYGVKLIGFMGDLVKLGDYKIALIIATVIISTTILLTLKKK